MVFSCDTVPLSSQPWCFWSVSFPNADLAFNVFQQIRIWGKILLSEVEQTNVLYNLHFTWGGIMKKDYNLATMKDEEKIS